MSTALPIESRRSRRRHVGLSARITGLDPELDLDTGSRSYSVMTARTCDVSDGGLSLMSSAPITRGARVVVELDLPDGRVLAMNARVVWIHSHENTHRAQRFGVELDVPHLGLAQASSELERSGERLLGPDRGVTFH
jgi:Tfp pilus assembly protein PilZ